jgi:hypothetical protein
VLGRLTEAGEREVCAQRRSVVRRSKERTLRERGARVVVVRTLNLPPDVVVETKERVALMGLVKKMIYLDGE